MLRHCLDSGWLVGSNPSKFSLYNAYISRLYIADMQMYCIASQYYGFFPAHSSTG